MVNKSKTPSPCLADRKRLIWLCVFVFALFSLLILQYYKIQIIEGDKWTKEAQMQHHLTIIEPFKRGLFYSNASLKAGHPDQPQPFVIDVPKFHLYIDPESIPADCKAEIAKMLIKLMKIKKPYSQKVQEQFFKKSRSRKVAMWLDQNLRNEIHGWWSQYCRRKKIPTNAIFFIQDYKRSYPFGPMLGQVLHTIREERDQATNQSIPTGGLELVFNSYLSGKDGKRQLLRSPRHPLESGKIVSEPEDGADVYLTINHYIQAIAEEEIAKAVKSANAKGGWAVMMDPQSGEILALAQYPEFAPSSYRNFFNDELLREHTKVKAVTDPYEPGSTIKPLTLALALKANFELKKQGKPPLFSPHEKMATANIRFPGRNKPLKDLRTHQYLNMYLALQKSSNVYMARLVQKIIETFGANWYRSALQDIFGFGIKTGVELPSESAGLLPLPGKKHPNGTLEWSAPTPYSLAIGHNLLVTSLQMVRSYAVIANGGFAVNPILVRKIVKTRRDGTSEILLDNTRTGVVKNPIRLLEPEIVEEVVKAAKFVTKPGGSAPKADIYGYTEAGKTATTEKIINGVYSKKDHISTFVGFAPAKNARFVLLIAIDEPEFKFIPGIGKNQHGGQCAAPAFREIASRTLQYLGVEPDDPHGYPVGDPRYDPQKADCIQKAQELKELYLLWNQ